MDNRFASSLYLGVGDTPLVGTLVGDGAMVGVGVGMGDGVGVGVGVSVGVGVGVSVGVFSGVGDAVSVGEGYQGLVLYGFFTDNTGKIQIQSSGVVDNDFLVFHLFYLER